MIQFLTMVAKSSLKCTLNEKSFEKVDLFFSSQWTILQFAFDGIGRLLHIGLGFLKFSLLLYNSDGKIREKVV